MLGRVMAKILKRILSLRNPTHYLLTWLGLKGRPLMAECCPLCQGTKEVLVRPSRLMGATYIDGGSGDERIEVCELCSEEGKMAELNPWGLTPIEEKPVIGVCPNCGGELKPKGIYGEPYCYSCDGYLGFLNCPRSPSGLE